MFWPVTTTYTCLFIASSRWGMSLSPATTHIPVADCQVVSHLFSFLLFSSFLIIQIVLLIDRHETHESGCNKLTHHERADFHMAMGLMSESMIVVNICNIPIVWKWNTKAERECETKPLQHPESWLRLIFPHSYPSCAGLIRDLQIRIFIVSSN